MTAFLITLTVLYLAAGVCIYVLGRDLDTSDNLADKIITFFVIVTTWLPLYLTCVSDEDSQ